MSSQLPEHIVNILTKKEHTCYAPGMSINFDILGNMTVCCANRKVILGTYPKNTIMDALKSPELVKLKQQLNNLDFSNGCNVCYKHLASGDYNNTILAKFDEEHRQKNALHSPYKGDTWFPKVMEFEITNVCNYECIMCGGHWSSQIRANREKLPAIPFVYDKNFVKQLEQFIPHLYKMNFLGGEPFAVPLYYEIWEKVIELNPNILVGITTNGSIYNERIKNLIQRHKNIKLVCSLDSLNPETYSFIRKNGTLSKVLDNLAKYKELGALSVITFNPMIQNWHEIQDIIRYCQTNNLRLTFNNVHDPLGGRIKGIHANGDWIKYDNISKTTINVNLKDKLPEVSLFTLPKKERIRICNTLKAQKLHTIPEYGVRVQSLIDALMNFEEKNAEDSTVLAKIHRGLSNSIIRLLSFNPFR